MVEDFFGGPLGGGHNVIEADTPLPLALIYYSAWEKKAKPKDPLTWNSSQLQNRPPRQHHNLPLRHPSGPFLSLTLPPTIMKTVAILAALAVATEARFEDVKAQREARVPLVLPRVLPASSSITLTACLSRS